MAIQLSHAEREGFTVVRLEGDFTMYHVYPVRKYMENLINNRIRRIALDFSKVDTLDSAGVGTLLRIHRQAIDYCGDLFIFGCQPSVMNVLRTLKVEDLIPISSHFEEGCSKIQGNS